MSMFISWGEDVCRISGSSHAASGVDKARIARSVELINFYDTLVVQLIMHSS